MKYAQWICIISLCLVLTLNDNIIWVEGGFAGRIIKGADWTRFVMCCMLKGCPYIYKDSYYGQQVDDNICRAVRNRGKVIACKCVKPKEIDNDNKLIGSSIVNSLHSG